MNQKRIVINGKTYNSVDEMPEDARRDYENAMRNFDKNQNGMPGALEGMASVPGSRVNVINTAKIIVNGQVYDSVEQLPPDVRAKYEQAMGALDANKNGIPDFAEGMMRSPDQGLPIAASFGTASPRPASSNPTPAAPTIEPESSGNWTLVAAGIALAGICLALVAAGAWYFFLQ